MNVALPKTQGALGLAGLPEFNHDIFDQGVLVIAEQELTRLTPDQISAFWSYFSSQAMQSLAPFERVASYLNSKVDQFEYSERTYTPANTDKLESGNCLSLALLTAAYADLAGVKISLQLMDNNRMYDLKDDYYVSSNHLRARLKETRAEDVESSQTWFQRSIRIDYFYTHGLKYIDNISRAQSASMFYSNMAVEHLFDDDLDAAFAYAHKALQLDSHNWSALNTVAISHRRLGDYQTAEEIYRFGIEFADKKSLFRKNYVLLLESQSRMAEAELVSKELFSQLDQDPWYWIHSGRKAFKDKKYVQATKDYDRALSLVPDLHQVHMYTAIAHYKAGNRQLAQEHMTAAVDHSPENSRYKRKLRAISK